MMHNIFLKSTLDFCGENAEGNSVVSHALTAGYYGAGQIKAHYTIYGRCLLEAKLEGTSHYRYFWTYKDNGTIS